MHISKLIDDVNVLQFLDFLRFHGVYKLQKNSHSTLVVKPVLLDKSIFIRPKLVENSEIE